MGAFSDPVFGKRNRILLTVFTTVVALAAIWAFWGVGLANAFGTLLGVALTGAALWAFWSTWVPGARWIQVRDQEEQWHRERRR